MPDRRDTLLQLLARYRPDPPLPWHADTCFLTLDVFRYICEHEPGEVARQAVGLVAEHSQVCGGCLRNVAARQAAAADDREREIYGNLYVASLRAFVRSEGGRLEIQPEAGGAWISMSPPPGTEDLLAGIEAFAPRSPGGQGFQILEVRSEEVFDHPERILQVLDESGAGYSQECAKRAAWEALALNTLCGHPNVPVFVRWRGRTKKLADGVDMWTRYRGLVDRTFAQGRRSDGQISEGEQILEFMGVINTYDPERARFAGYAKETLKFRAIDRERQRAREKNHLVTGDVGVDTYPSGELEHGQSAVTAAVRREARESWVRNEAEDARRDQVADRVARLRPLLTPREQAIVDLLTADPELKDHELAERLKVTRETITRDRAKMREKAKSIE